MRLQQILGVCGELLPSLTWDLINGNVWRATLTPPGRSVLGMRREASVHMLGLRIVPPQHYVRDRYDRLGDFDQTHVPQYLDSHCCRPPSSWGHSGSRLSSRSTGATICHEPVVVLLPWRVGTFVSWLGVPKSPSPNHGTGAAGRQGESGAVHGRADGNAHHAGSGIHQIRPDTVVARGPLLRRGAAGTAPAVLHGALVLHRSGIEHPALDPFRPVQERPSLISHARSRRCT